MNWEIENYYGTQGFYSRHGSRLTNIVSILSEGLKLPPKDAPISGYMFGKVFDQNII